MELAPIAGTKTEPNAVRVLATIELVPIAGTKTEPNAVRVLAVIELVPIAGTKTEPATVRVLAVIELVPSAGTDSDLATVNVLAVIELALIVGTSPLKFVIPLRFVVPLKVAVTVERKGGDADTAVGDPDGVRASRDGPKSTKLLVCAVRTATVPVIEVATLAPEVPTEVLVRGAKEGVKFPV
jgi:hypothetical protein